MPLILLLIERLPTFSYRIDDRSPDMFRSSMYASEGRCSCSLQRGFM